MSAFTRVLFAMPFLTSFLWAADISIADDQQALRPDGTSWMLQAKYGLFMHYQYRILLGYSVRTRPQFPAPARMTAAGWNRFVDGFDWQTIGKIVRAANPAAVIAFSYGRNEEARVAAGVDDYTAGDTWTKQDLVRLTPARLPAQAGILWHGKIYCGNVYHGQGTANQFGDQELIDWVRTCNRQGGVCTLDWPLEPRTGLVKDFGFAQLKRITQALKGDETTATRETGRRRAE